MDTWKPDVLVIGPGGVKGLKVLGFLTPLEDCGTLESVKDFCGASVGSIISLLLICGYKVREIINEAIMLDIFSELNFSSISAVIENKGLVSNEPMKKLLSKLVENKFGVVPSLHGLYSMTGKSLITTTLNVSDEESMMMNPFTHPELSCVDAVMFSVNIPFVFYQLSHEGKVCVDGGLGNPYPVDYFDDGERKILGVYMKTIRSSLIGSTSTYFHKIVNSAIEERRNDIIRASSDKCLHIRLEVLTSGTFSMTIQEKTAILIEGVNQGQEFLDGKYIFTLPEKSKYNKSN